MTERIKNIIIKNKCIKILLFVLLIATLIFYFKIFFTTGLYFDDVFLKKEVFGSDNYYTGKSKYGNIQIIVKGLENKTRDVDVIYNLPNNINKKYTVSFKNPNSWDFGIENIKDENGNIIFEGRYMRGAPVLIDNNDEPFMEESNIIFISNRLGRNPYNDNYKITLINVADFANFTNDTIRGERYFLIIAIFLFAITLIDIKFPLLFFTFGHFLEVKDPKPSDFYITMQRICWFLYPIIGIILMLVAIQ